MTQSATSNSDTLSSSPEFYEIADGLLVVPRNSSLLNSVDVRHRFLDRLILPCPLGNLNAAQIVAINRFREWERNADPQFAKALRARRMVAEACTAISASNILEIGMGKFPIVDDYGPEEYFGIDIDQEAINDCLSRGIQAGDVSQVSGNFDTIVSIYSLHFSVESRVFEAIANSSSTSTVMLSVLLDDGSQHFSNLLSDITAIFPLTRVIVSSASRRERFMISGNIGAQERFSAAVSTILSLNVRD